MKAGEVAHRHHGEGLRVSLSLKRLGYALLALAVVLVIVTLVLR
jgi:hypothetical protein